MSEPAKPAVSGKKCFRTGASLYGKFAAVLIYEDAVEVRSISTALVILILWLTALVVLGLSFWVVPSLLISLILTLGSGFAMFLFLLRRLPGKLERRMEYREIASFVRDDPEFIFNLKNNFMFSVKASPKKQEKLIADLTAAFRENPDYSLARMGKYLKVNPRGAEPGTGKGGSPS